MPKQVKTKTGNSTIDQQIAGCLNSTPPKSFFLFAGAGSGKTRALVNALNVLRQNHGRRLRLSGQRISVITYTNAACDEITRRLDFSPLVAVSTIHSFAWDLIRGFNSDFRAWLTLVLQNDIAELRDQIRTGRPGTKIAAERQRSIESKQQRLDTLPSIRAFIYNPNGDNVTRDALNHSEVIKIAADFLTNKPLMQELLLCKSPFLFIDESQDTNKHLMEAFFHVEAAHRHRFCVGLFGDTMQRIYADGKLDLGVNLPESWATPAITVNYRCPRRVVGLINKLRSAADDHAQECRPGASDGHVRLFVVQSKVSEKQAKESLVRERMASIVSDESWRDPLQVKTLTLEHHMAASRMGFLDIFEPLYRIDGFRTGLLDGSLPAARFFTELVLPTIEAAQRNDGFAVSAIVRRTSPLLSKEAFQNAGDDQSTQLKKAKQAVDVMTALWNGGSDPKLLDILECISEHKLWPIPESLNRFALTKAEKEAITVTDDPAPENEVDRHDAVEALRNFLSAPFSQVAKYSDYVKGVAPFDTHQGVKGLEFPRVLVVLDDEEARGFLFSFDKLFGAKEKTKTDLDNEREGKETGIARTRRLFYVTCSRAEQSLAVIAYSSNPAKVREHALTQGWFSDSEIEMLA